MFDEAITSLQKSVKSMGAADKTGLLNKGLGRASSLISSTKSKYMSDLMGKVNNGSLIKRTAMNFFDSEGLGADVDLNTFTSKFSDLIRSNLFQIEIVSPSGLSGQSNEFQQLKYFCKSVEVPFLTFTESKVNYNMRSYSVVDGSDIDPITMTFSLPSNNLVLKSFVDWYNIIQRFDTKHFGYKFDYGTNITINIYDRNSASIFSATLSGAYPANISGLDYAYESSDTLSELSVTFNYDEVNYSVQKINTSPIDILF